MPIAPRDYTEFLQTKHNRLLITAALRKEAAPSPGNPNSTKRKTEAFFSCLCDCGKTVTIRSNDVLKSLAKSCGCLALELWKVQKKTHGMTKTPTWASWSDMLSRCTNPKNKAYSIYKNRAPDTRWHSFSNFLEDMGVKPEGYTIERVHNDKPYSKENCIWLPLKAQVCNTSRTIWVVKNKGIDLKILKEACVVENVKYNTVHNRLTRGSCMEEALPGWRSATKEEITQHQDAILKSYNGDTS